MNPYVSDPTLYNTAPAPEGRLLKEMAVYALLEALNIPFVRLDHGPTPSIEACREIDTLLGIEICKNLFLCNAQKTQFYLLMMPGSKPFKTKDLSKQIGSSRLSFAAPEYMQQFLNITPGAVSILGLMNDTQHQVRLLIDREVVSHAYIGCHTCVNTARLKIRTADILEKFLPHTGHEATLVEL